jgi:hypothetical protein
VLGGEFGLSGLGSMARYDGHGACRLANRIAAAKATNGWIHMLQSEQRALGDMGCSSSGVCIDRPAALSFPDEPSRAQKKLEREGK